MLAILDLIELVRSWGWMGRGESEWIDKTISLVIKEIGNISYKGLNCIKNDVFSTSS